MTVALGNDISLYGYVGRVCTTASTSSRVSRPSGTRPSLTSTMCRRSWRMASSSLGQRPVRRDYRQRTDQRRRDRRAAGLPDHPEHVLDVHEPAYPPGVPLYHREARQSGTGGQHLQRRRGHVLGHRRHRRPTAAARRRRCGSCRASAPVIRACSSGSSSPSRARLGDQVRPAPRRCRRSSPRRSTRSARSAVPAGTPTSSSSSSGLVAMQNHSIGGPSQSTARSGPARVRFFGTISPSTVCRKTTMTRAEHERDRVLRPTSGRPYVRERAVHQVRPGPARRSRPGPASRP